MRNDTADSHEQHPFGPNAFMRGRRPYLFFDTTEIDAPNLNREIFSYHLELKEDACSEIFAKRLAQKFISPNICPQTSPTGGGDPLRPTQGAA